MVISNANNDELDRNQVRKAVVALVAYLKKKSNADNSEEKKDLFADVDEENIYVQIGLKKSPPKSTLKSKPRKIKLSNSLYNRFGNEVCLITKDPQRTYKDWLEENPIKSITKVIGISKLKTKYKQYEDRRQLLSQYSLFLADSRIVNMLPAALGVKFFAKKRQPMVVNLKTPESLQKSIKETLLCTSFILSGPCNSIKIATDGMELDEVIDNIMIAVPQIVEHCKGWKNIQTIGIKTAESICLPFYNSLPIDEPNANANNNDNSNDKKAKRKRNDNTNDNDNEDDNNTKKVKKMKKNKKKVKKKVK